MYAEWTKMRHASKIFTRKKILFLNNPKLWKCPYKELKAFLKNGELGRFAMRKIESVQNFVLHCWCILPLT